MATITPPALAALMKSKISGVDFSSGIIGNDELILAMSEAMVVAFSDNTIFASPINEGGLGSYSVFSIDPIPTIAWMPTPTGTYTSFSGAGTALSTIQFVVDTTGGWTVSGFGDSVDEVFGLWRPTNDNNTVSYEISINTSGSTANSVGGIPLNGTWVDLDSSKGVSLSDSAAGTKLTGVTVEIRVKNNPTNTTTPATFNLQADGTAPI